MKSKQPKDGNSQLSSKQKFKQHVDKVKSTDAELHSKWDSKWPKWRRRLKIVFSLGVVAFTIGVMFTGCRSYLSINSRQRSKENLKYQADLKKEAELTKESTRLRASGFNDPLKYKNNKVLKSQSTGSPIEFSALQPVKIMSKDDKVLMKNPDAWKVHKVELLKDDVFKYYGPNGQWALGFGPTFSSRDYTLKQAKSLAVKSGNQLVAVNLLKDQKVTSQSGPYVMYKSVAEGKAKANNQSKLAGAVGSRFQVTDVKQIGNRVYFVTDKGTYIEAQRNFISAMPSTNS